MSTTPVDPEPSGMRWQGDGDRALHVLREYRNLLNAYAAPPDLDSEQAVRTRGPVERLDVAALPAAMQQALERYARANADVKVEALAYIVTGASGAAVGTSAITELPSEDEMVVLALTETVASASRVEAHSQVLLLRRVRSR